MRRVTGSSQNAGARAWLKSLGMAGAFPGLPLALPMLQAHAGAHTYLDEGLEPPLSR